MIGSRLNKPRTKKAGNHIAIPLLHPFDIFAASLSVANRN